MPICAPALAPPPLTSQPIASSLSMASPELPRSMVPGPLGVAEGKQKAYTPRAWGMERGH